MQITFIRLVDVVLSQSLKVYTDTSEKYEDWEAAPVFTFGHTNEGDFIQEIRIEIVRTIGSQRAKIIVTTSFEIGLTGDIYKPTTEENFIEYASMQQIALAHARAFFIRETRGTKFADGILPVDSFFHAVQKIKLAIFNIGRLN